MKPGFPPQPTNLRVLRGNPGRRPLPSREPRPDIALPACPAWLDVEARSEWRRMGKLLLTVKCIALQDRAVLAAYCAAWSRFRRATEAVQKVALTQTTPQGSLRAPEIAIAADAERTLLRLAIEFGGTPAARSRLTAPDDGQHDDKAKAFFGY